MQVVAEYQLEVRLDHYRNPSHKTVNGTCCEESCDNKCDNYFVVKLRLSNGNMQRKQTEVYKDNDDIHFDNTLAFCGNSQYWKVRMKIYNCTHHT